MKTKIHFPSTTPGQDEKVSSDFYITSQRFQLLLGDP